MKFIRSLDFFTKPKDEIDSSTGVGGLFSIIGILCGLLFFIIEVSSWLSITWIREMSVDHDSITRKERVNLDLTFYKCPCELLTLNQEEEGGLHTLDIPLNKERYTSKGDYIEKYTPNNTLSRDDQYNSLVKAIEDGEYCRIHGNFTILEVPGNFHIGFRPRLHDYIRLPDNLIKKVSLDVLVNHLSFGPTTSHKTIYKKFGMKNNFSPYDGLVMNNLQASDKINFFIKIVPNYYFFKENAKAGMLANQFSLAHQKREIVHIDHYVRSIKWNGVETPTFRVNYEFSPITINYRVKNNSFTGFLVDTLAIMGGIFSIMGMINQFVLTKYRHLRR